MNPGLLQEERDCALGPCEHMRGRSGVLGPRGRQQHFWREADLGGGCALCHLIDLSLSRRFSEL